MSDFDQKRAEHALKKIQALQEEGYGHYGNYVSFVKALPATILQIGLGQALATELASSGNGNDTEKGHANLLKSLQEWLGRSSPKAPYPNAATKPNGLLTELTSGTQEQYIYAQYEAIAYLDWLKKFAVALLDTENNQQNGQRQENG